jgi:Uma2 family endonuclease
LDQPEFHRRYEAYPDPSAKFELIGGVVYMMSPAGYEHGRGDLKLSGLIFQYERETPGVEGAQNTTIVLGKDSEPQPDNLLMVRREYGGNVQIRGRKTKYVVGPPELVLEVAHSSRAIDLYEKRDDYHRGGVREYIVLDVQRQSVHWFDLTTNEELSLPSDGVLRSRAFPGFWIDTSALLARNVRRLAACLDRGLVSPEHATYVKELAQRRAQLRKTAASKHARRRKE